MTSNIFINHLNTILRTLMAKMAGSPHML